jgi:hypothetical protein
MKLVHIGLAVLAAMALVGCSGGEEATPAPVVSESGAMTSASETLDTSYEGALDASSQLILGTINLEGTENAVTPEQAKALLPLWQALRGGVTAQAEMSALMKQIERTMTAEQLAAIAAMQLTQEDMQAWMQEQGLGMGGGPGQPPGGGQDLSEEERATRQAEFAAGGGFGGGGEIPPEMATRQAEFASMSEEEREAMRATMEAGGGMPGGAGGRPGGAGGGRQSMMLLNPLIELLTQRAAE